MEITFKNATANDIANVFDLNRNLIDKYETDSNLDFEKIYNWVKKKLENNIENYQCIYFKGIKVGYFFLHNKGKKLELDDFFVFNKFQEKGIGSKILEYVDSIAKKQNKDVLLYVFAKNHKAIKLYLRNGFEIIENINDSRYIMNKKINLSTIKKCKVEG